MFFTFFLRGAINFLVGKKNRCFFCRADLSETKSMNKRNTSIDLTVCRKDGRKYSAKHTWT